MLIDSIDKLNEALKFIHENDLLAYDTETTGLNTRKDIVVGFGFSNATTGYYMPLYRYCPTLKQLVLTDLPPQSELAILKALSTKKLLMFNASFDARITKQSLYVDLLPALYADVLLLKHTCDEEFPFGLKEIATKLWGHNVKEEKEAMQASIKANGGTAKQYYKSDVSILSRYCIQDCLLTYQIYNHYKPILASQGLEQFYFSDEVLPLYKEVTIPMEEAGVCLDMPKLNEAIVDINKVIHEVEQGIQAAIIPHLSLFTTWFLNKDYPQQTPTGKQPAWAKKYASQYEAWSAENPNTNMFNLNSKYHLKKLFFDTLKEEALSRTPPSKNFPNGQPQVDEEFLELMAQKYDWCEKLIEYNKLNKIKGTYLIRFLEESEDGKFYPSFQQHRTVSGRYSGDLQQLPRPLEQRPVGEPQIAESIIYFTNLIRELIVPTRGNMLVSADYEQLEPTIFAHTSGDPALQGIFNEGQDFYSTVAIRTENLSGVSANKESANYLGTQDKAARQKAKAYALGIAYGMTGYKLKFELGCTDEEADQLVEDYLNAFPDLKEWMYASRDTAKSQGFIRAQTGRVRHMPQAKEIFETYGPCIDNDLELWKRYNNVPSVYAAAKSARKLYKNLLNNAINFQVQSLAASIVNRAAIALARDGLIPIMQVHDELVYDLPSSNLASQCVLIKQQMENIIKLSVPLRTIPQYGTNYRKCK